MPTLEADDRFLVDHERLSSQKKEAFKAAVAKFGADLRRGSLRQGLPVKRVQGQLGVWEMTWAPDGRATFEYGPPRRSGEPHFIWRRIGGHDIFANP